MNRCRHSQQPVLLDGGLGSVTVYASAGTTQDPTLLVPDFGLYADKIWSPRGRNEFIAWTDGRAPRYPEVARLQIIDAFIRVCQGETVEVGCIGGHGRTGTILACMARLAGIENPVHYVRWAYCAEAVECNAQAEYVRWFDTECFGTWVQ